MAMNKLNAGRASSTSRKGASRFFVTSPTGEVKRKSRLSLVGHVGPERRNEWAVSGQIGPPRSMKTMPRKFLRWRFQIVRGATKKLRQAALLAGAFVLDAMGLLGNDDNFIAEHRRELLIGEHVDVLHHEVHRAVGK
jgi:hypothetical protein